MTINHERKVNSYVEKSAEKGPKRTLGLLLRSCELDQIGLDYI